MFVKRTKACDSSIIDVLDHVLHKGVVIDVGRLAATDLLASYRSTRGPGDARSLERQLDRERRAAARLTRDP
jgi:hypothetical protein